MSEVLPGDVIAGHRIEAVAGRGGMGVVYVGTHLRLKRRRAIKVIAAEYSQDEDFRRRFERESEVAAAIEHPNVIPIYDAGEDGDRLYIVMRFVEGADLRAAIATAGRLEPRRAVALLGQVAAALDSAHAAGLVHRDVKPANVLVARDGEREHAYLTDFGLTKWAAAETSGITATGMFVGTLDYIAPEQLEGHTDPRSDVYSLGCVAFEALTGRVPFQAATLPAKMWSHLHEAPPRASETASWLPQALDSPLLRAMAKDPAARYQSAGELMAEVTVAVALRETLPSRDAVPPTDVAAAPPPTSSSDAPTRKASTSRDAVPPTEGAATRPPRSPQSTSRARARPLRRWHLVALTMALGAAVVVALAVALLGGGGSSDPNGSARAPTNAPSIPLFHAVRPGEGIGPVSLGLSKAAIEADLGPQGSREAGWSRHGTDLTFDVRYYTARHGGRLVENPEQHRASRIYVGSLFTEDTRFELAVGGTTLNTASSRQEVQSALVHKEVAGQRWRLLECPGSGGDAWGDQVLGHARDAGRWIRTGFEFAPGEAVRIYVSREPPGFDPSARVRCPY